MSGRLDLHMMPQDWPRPASRQALNKRLLRLQVDEIGRGAVQRFCDVAAEQAGLRGGLHHERVEA